MTTRQTRSPHLQRSPGERAFDRVLISVVGGVLLLSLFGSETGSPFALVFGIAAFVFWLLLLRGVVRAWHDPYARVLRFSSSLLLACAVLIIFSLLRVPFQ
jgi:hypothetical protein